MIDLDELDADVRAHKELWVTMPTETILALIAIARAAQEIRECPLTETKPEVKPTIYMIHCAEVRYLKLAEALKAIKAEGQE
jgi:tRNA A37 threonylcarbamoyladenosine synthetase subunit TsaC/SUA5/YrdC